MPKPIYTCKRCHQPFSPDPRNVGRQLYCRRKTCSRKGKRERQNRWHRERYAEDPAFREAAKERVRHQRQGEKASAAPVVTPLVAERLERVAQAVLGLASQLGGEDDPATAAALMDGWARRGASLGGSMASGP
jgi:hypothetical protein